MRFGGHVVVAVGCLLTATVVRGGAQVPLGAAARFNHAPFDSLLAAHVRNGLVDYDAFAKAPAFPRYLAALGKAPVASMDEAEQIAFWLNVYNAYTIQLIVQHGERQSIRRINPTLGFLRLKGPWNERLVHAAGRTYTLDEVLHRILRKQFHEPRVHYAVVPGSMGAPPLRSEAYTGERLESQLEDQARRLLSDTTRTWYRKGVLGVNQIFAAYERDFASSRKELVQALAPYITLRTDEKQRDRLFEGKAILFPREYDWSLNIMKPR